MAPFPGLCSQGRSPPIPKPGPAQSATASDLKELQRPVFTQPPQCNAPLSQGARRQPAGSIFQPDGMPHPGGKGNTPLT